ncbi:MAG: DUF1453 family protein [Sphingomonadales bacterium]|nr:DUF1453 family protein [Sphingomonadales bacterium]
MPAGQGMAQTLLPLGVVAVVFLLRFRNLNRARRLRPGRLWLVPGLIALVIGLGLWVQPPVPAGWLLFALGLVAGWWRGRFMHMAYDAAADVLMVRQSPAALLFLMALFAVRRAASAEFGIGAGAGPHAALAPSALLASDALMGFALGLVAGQRIELWIRARRLRAGAATSPR